MSVSILEQKSPLSWKRTLWQSSCCRLARRAPLNYLRAISKELYGAGTLLLLLSSKLKHKSGSELEGKTMGLQSGRPWVIHTSRLVTAVVLLGLTSFAQQPRVLAPHQPIPP